tara:strand:+ start:892 stop:1506 length:615 start_codon:yes stop_codon:yes gene_type:complete
VLSFLLDVCPVAMKLQLKTTDMKTQKTENLYKLIQKKTKGMYETRVERTIRFRLLNKQNLPTDKWQISIYKRGNNIFLNEQTINDLTELKINEMVNVKDPFYSRKKEYEIELKYFDVVAGEYYLVLNGDLDKAYKKYILNRIEMYERGFTDINTKNESVPYLTIASDTLTVKASKPNKFEFDILEKQRSLHAESLLKQLSIETA